MYRYGYDRKKIKDRIKTAGFTAKDVADACCLANPNAVWRWQKGTNMPTLDNLVVIAEMCGCRLGCERKLVFEHALLILLVLFPVT